MSQSPIEQAIAAGAEWMEANKNHPDAEAFACVASAMADLSRVAYPGKKETAGDAAVDENSFRGFLIEALPRTLDKTEGSVVRSVVEALVRLSFPRKTDRFGRSVI